MTITRSEMPVLHAPANIPVMQAIEKKLDNGLSLYVINAGNEDVVKLDIIFPSELSGGSHYSVALACHQLLDSGTKYKKAIEIAEAFDFYGSHFQTDFGPDWKSINLYSLTRFFSETLDLVCEILNESVFSAEELDTWKTRSIQSLKVNHEKVSWLAKTAFNETLFGEQHPYGYTSVEADISTLDAESINKYYQQQYPIDKVTLIVSGKIDDQITRTINDKLGSIKINQGKKDSSAIIRVAENSSVKKTIDKKDAVQCGIRIGKKLFSKNHPDYPALQIVNTILGGYFGSRLMSNIREDKGYTYGIGSGIHPHLHSGYFFITTEVGKDVRNAALKEIYFELNRMANEPVPEAELSLVRNYLVGAFQRSLDGPFSLADRFRGLHLFNLGYEYLDSYLHLVQTITPEKVMEISARHLQPDSMTEIIAG